MDIKIPAGWTLLIFGITASPAVAQGTATETIGIEIQIDPVFVVEVQSEAGNVILGPLLPGTGTISEKAEVIIRTNRGQPYQVVQRLEERLMSDRGADFALDGVQFFASDGLKGGRSEVRAPKPLAPGPAVLFTSNLRGDADRFSVFYTVSTGPIVPEGNYRGRIQIEGNLK
jgi:hypothetical protein